MAKSIARRVFNNARARRFRKGAFRLESLEPRNLLASATPDSYTTNEDTVLTTGQVAVVPLRSPGWDINDELLNSVNQYPTDGGAHVWNATNYDVTTSVIGATASVWDRNLTAPFDCNPPNCTGVVTGLTAPVTNVHVPPATETTFLGRKTFTLTAAQAASTTGTINYVCDSGCIFYVNGVRAGSTANMAAVTAPTPTSFAADAGNEAAQTLTVTFGGAGNPTLVAGTNVLAIETHNDSLTSSDIGFDASLSVAGGQSGVAANDTHATPYTVAVGTAPTNGTLNLLADGNFTYTPNANFNGTDTFTYTIADPTASPPVTVTITVNPVNDVPIGVPDSYAANEGATITITGTTPQPFIIPAGSNWSYSDTGVDEDTVHATWKQGPSAGFNPAAAGWKGPAPSELGYGDMDEATVIICDPDPTTCIETPDLGDNYITSYFWRTFDISGAIPPQLKIGLVRDDGGVVYINGHEVFRSNMPTGAITYTTAGGGNIVSETQFFETVVDTSTLGLQATGNTIAVEIHQSGGGSSDVSFNLRLSNPNEGVLVNDPADPEGSPITAVLDDTSGIAGKGTLTFNSNGTFTFVPNAMAVGALTFTYKISDGTDLSAPVTVTLTYTSSNAAPVAVNDSYFTREGQTLSVTATTGTSVTMVPLAATGWDINDELLDADNQYPTDAAGRTWNARDYDVSTSRIGATPSVWDTNLTAPFDCTTPNCTGSVAAFTGTKTNVNVPPATETTFLARKSFTLSAADAASAFGRITYTCDSGCIIYINGVRAGTSPNMAAIASPLPATPAADAGDEDLPHATFTFPFGGAGNPTLIAGSNVIAVETHNDGPGSSDIGFDLMLEGVSLAGVLSNDSDPEGSPLTAQIADASNVGGNLTLNPNGTFTYTPNAGVSGTRTFTYTASDGVRTSQPATVTFTISPSDSGPYTAVADTYTTPEDVDLVIAGNSTAGSPQGGLMANDLHPGDESDPVTITILTQATNGVVTLNGNTGGFTYNPDEEFSGSDSFVYQVNDGFGSITSATVTVTVTNVDDPPEGAPDTYAVSGTFTVPATTTYLGRRSNWEFLDSVNNGLQDNPASTAEPYPTDAGGHQWYEEAFDTTTSNGDGAWEFGPGVFGSPQFGDNPGASTILDGIDGAFNGTDNSVTTYLFRTTFNVANGASLSALGINLFADDGAIVYINGRDVLRQNMPASPPAVATNTAATAASADEFSYVRHDNVDVTGLLHNGINTVAVEIHQSANDSSDVAFDMAITNAGPISVLSNDSDRENNPLTATVLATDTQPQHGTVTMQADGRFTFTPTPGYTGMDTFQYRVHGATQSAAAVTVTLNITPSTGCIAGDADLDNNGVVNKADLVILSRNYGSRAPAANEGDVNCDGKIGLRDLVLLRNQIVTPSPAAPDALVAAVDGNAVDRVLAGLDRAIDATSERAPRAATRLAQIRDRISQAADDAGDSGSEVNGAVRRVIRATRGRIAAHARAIGDLFDRTA